MHVIQNGNTTGVSRSRQRASLANLVMDSLHQSLFQESEQERHHQTAVTSPIIQCRQLRIQLDELLQLDEQACIGKRGDLNKKYLLTCPGYFDARIELNRRQ